MADITMRTSSSPTESSIADALRSCLKYYGYQAYENDDATDFRFQCHTSSGDQWRSQVIINPEAPLARLYVYATDDLYPDQYQDGVFRLAAMVTETIIFGTFFVQWDTEAVIYRDTIDLRDVVVTPKLFERWLALSAFPLDLWSKAYQRVKMGKADAQSSLSAAMIEMDCYEAKWVSKRVRRALLTLEDGGLAADSSKNEPLTDSDKALVEEVVAALEKEVSSRPT